MIYAFNIYIVFCAHGDSVVNFHDHKMNWFSYFFQEADIRKMLNQRIHTNNAAADQATIDSLIEDLLHHKRQNSEDSGVGEGNFEEIFS
jgi:hypothetical protein